MADIFVSYSSDDRGSVEPLAARLEAAGYSVWWDREIKGGMLFSERIEAEVRKARVVVVVWSPSSLKSRWVADEAELALQTGVVVPITLGGVQPPMGFRQLQAIDFSGWRGASDESRLDSLLDALGQHLESDPPDRGASALPAKSSISIAPDASIAVLPFENMSDDPEQGYFVDGMVEDILTTLAKIPVLFVIARNSSFAFKGRTVDVREVGRELGVKYVVEGGIRKAGNRVRVTVQLVECAGGQHLWADRYDGELDDVFDLQDRITHEIVTALEIKLTEGEQVRVWRERSGTPLVYEQYSKGRELYWHFTKQTHNQARQELESALKIDPDYTPALIQLGYTLADQGRFGWAANREESFQAARAVADRALAVDPDYGEAYSVMSYVFSYQRRHDDAVKAAEHALALSPNNATAFHLAALSHIFAGSFRLGCEYEEHARRLSPMDLAVYTIELARAQFHLGAYSEAQDLAGQVLTIRPQWLTAKTISLAALWRLGMQDEARKITAEILAAYPGFSVSRWALGYPYKRECDLNELMDPLKEAGLPA